MRMMRNFGATSRRTTSSTTGGDLAFEELRAYFALRSAFNDLRIVREQVIADGDFFAARTMFLGRFH